MLKNYLLALAVLILIIIKPFKTNAQAVNVQDSLALVSLYNSTNGANWTNHTNWLTVAPVSTWFGITVANNRVTKISMNRNKLNGALPNSIGNLSEIIFIALNGNQLNGAIPTSIGKLSKLTLLQLITNQLSGKIPSELGNVISLTSLSLQDNQLSDSIPSSLGRLVNLTDFSLGKNQLAGKIPESLASLSNLTSLSLQENLFTGTFPLWITNLMNLTYLNLESTQLTGNIPTALGNLSKLQILYLFKNQLSGEIPLSLGNLTNLTDLFLSDNQLTGSIPSTLGNLSKLVQLDLSKNDLNNVIPSSLSAFSSLQYLGLSFNKFTFNGMEALVNNYGNSITYYSNQTNVIINQQGNVLSVSAGGTLSNNTYKWYLDGVAVATKTGDSTFTIPSNGNYSVDVTNAIATNLILHSNSLLQDSLALVELYNSTNGPNWRTSTNWLTTKPLSTWYGVAVTNGRVSTLDLNFNGLTGPLPKSLYNLTSLETLSLYVNGITGYISPDIGNLTKLTRLDLMTNYLTGSIPASLSKLTSLKFLNTENNNFTDTIPDVFANYNQLLSFDFSNNQLTGNIPASLGNVLSLKYLYLNNNHLTGSIPASLGKITNINSLVLNNNYLSDSIPVSLTNISYINQFQISNNKFTFSGMEGIAKIYSTTPFIYAPQANIQIKRNKNTLMVSVGGTPANNTFNWYKNGIFLTSKKADSTYQLTAAGKYTVIATNSAINQLTLTSDTLNVNGDSLIMPTKSNIEFANLEYTDATGWTHYYFNNNTPLDISDDTLLLSIKKNGQNIGTIGDGTFTVKLAATANAGSNTGLLLTNPLINNASGYWVMNRFWQVTPTKQPTTKSVGVRFYYNNQDVADVNGSYPSHNLAKDKLIFFKATGGNPDPTTNLSGATKLVGILPNTYASDTTWTYHPLSDTTQYAEYSVASFSGGGGGATGNGKTISTATVTALPVTFINFVGHLVNSRAVLNWQTATEIDASFFNIQRSNDGINFSNVGKVAAVGNAITLNGYSFTDASINANSTYYYRLQSIDKDGSFTFSNIIALKLDGKVGFTIFPNPVKQTLFAQIQNNKTEQITITITDLQGRKVQVHQVTLNAGSNGFSFDVSNLASGSYWLVNSSTKQNIMFVKQ